MYSTLWPSNHSTYGVASSSWKGGKGDVLKEFAAAARAAGIKICYCKSDLSSNAREGCELL